ncbi:hypothetical protein ABZT51_42365 [Streptomyces sp. NPDC005373]|uniref:hypothetical protein n=1 Tax=Streptomyces sp. NPDC005373 TaxID=3156879 RepID=UPI0033A1A284
MRELESEELFLAPGDPRWFGFGLAEGQGRPFFSMAIPSRPKASKQSLWTIAHGIETNGRSGGGEFVHHKNYAHYVTVQVADPAVDTPFTIHSIVLSEEF